MLSISNPLEPLGPAETFKARTWMNGKGTTFALMVPRSHHAAPGPSKTYCWMISPLELQWKTSTFSKHVTQPFNALSNKHLAILCFSQFESFTQPSGCNIHFPTIPKQSAHQPIFVPSNRGRAAGEPVSPSNTESSAPAPVMAW